MDLEMEYFNCFQLLGIKNNSLNVAGTKRDKIYLQRGKNC